jgi:hypothetical protein
MPKKQCCGSTSSSIHSGPSSSGPTQFRAKPGNRVSSKPAQQNLTPALRTWRKIPHRKCKHTTSFPPPSTTAGCGGRLHTPVATLDKRQPPSEPTTTQALRWSLCNVTGELLCDHPAPAIGPEVSVVICSRLDREALASPVHHSRPPWLPYWHTGPCT